MPEELLGLFPLQVVLFPQSALPLHIFEERYKTLIRECLAGRKEFGINLVKGSEISRVGCTATVSSVVQSYGDGRMDIVVRGNRRYRIERYDATRAQYLMGVVRYIESEPEDVDGGLASDTITLYNEFIGLVYKDRIPALSLDNLEECISYVMAQKSGMSLEQRQRLLEVSSENERLQALKLHFTDLIPKLVKLEEIERVIRSDGYL